MELLLSRYWSRLPHPLLLRKPAYRVSIAVNIDKDVTAPTLTVASISQSE